ncbi:hypothetical protein [Candidatus Nitrospira nitrificans]|uniref:hypothetical protein n=1 Tax=Candidatus Nitrospira nitrificans TaxID=1742973 RepID=UPI000A860A1E|nr:hypothetical protein [Candidatus Nitrospira nitrificans]
MLLLQVEGYAAIRFSGVEDLSAAQRVAACRLNLDRRKPQKPDNSTKAAPPCL